MKCPINRLNADLSSSHAHLFRTCFSSLCHLRDSKCNADNAFFSSHCHLTVWQESGQLSYEDVVLCHASQKL